MDPGVTLVALGGAFVLGTASHEVLHAIPLYRRDIPHQFVWRRDDGLPGWIPGFVSIIVGNPAVSVEQHPLRIPPTVLRRGALMPVVGILIGAAVAIPLAYVPHSESPVAALAQLVALAFMISHFPSPSDVRMATVTEAQWWGWAASVERSTEWHRCSEGIGELPLSIPTKA